jgi:hypothetical protein
MISAEFSIMCSILLRSRQSEWEYILCNWQPVARAVTLASLRHAVPRYAPPRCVDSLSGQQCSNDGMNEAAIRPSSALLQNLRPRSGTSKPHDRVEVPPLARVLRPPYWGPLSAPRRLLLAVLSSWLTLRYRRRGLSGSSPTEGLIWRNCLS